MKLYTFIFVVLLFSSCSNKQKKLGNSILIDFDKNVSSICYSDFVDSLSYLTLNIKDDSFLSNVDRLYIDDGLVFLKDERMGGIMVFSQANGTMVSHLNYFGQGPGEFGAIRAFTLEKKKNQIHIFCYPFLHKYTYDGHFLETIKLNINLVDFCCLETGEYICLAPEDIRGENPEGVWLVDSAFQVVKTLKEIPANQLLAVRAIFYNPFANGIYYYDPVWEDFSYITRDSVELIYSIDFKQRVPEEERMIEMSENLRLYSYINTFAYSDQYILFNYFNFNRAPSYWTLLDRETNQITVSTELLNNITNVQIKSNNLFYVDNQTWCRVLDFEENNPDITIEFLHLTNGHR